jgi:hypothetical protein
VDLAFYTDKKVAYMDGIAVAEVKMDAQNRASSFLAQMRDQKVHPMGFSKYCIGVSMLYDQVKKNSLKPRMLKIGKIAEGVSHE